jgi:uncharacterized protein (DUF1330 family)
MEERYTVIIEATFNEGKMKSEEFKEYSTKAGALGEKAGAVTISKNMIEKNLDQGDTPHVIFVIEFPSRDNAVRFLTSEEYTSLIPLRRIVFKEVKILLTK